MNEGGLGRVIQRNHCSVPTRRLLISLLFTNLTARVTLEQPKVILSPLSPKI